MNIYRTFFLWLCAPLMLPVYSSDFQIHFKHEMRRLHEKIDDEYGPGSNLTSEDEFNRLCKLRSLLELDISKPITNEHLAYRPVAVEKIIHSLARSVKSLPAPIETIIFDYIVLKEEIEARKLKKLLDKCYIQSSQVPANLSDRLNSPDDLSKVMNLQNAFGYRLLEVLGVFLYKAGCKNIKKSISATSVQKKNKPRSHRTYHDIERKGWEGLSFLLSKSLLHHCINEKFICASVLDPDVRRGIELFMPAHHSKYCIEGDYWLDSFEEYITKNAD